jgi:pilus assembly protein CpaB
LAVDAATAAPPRGVDVTTAARDLPAGHTLGAGDLRSVAVPRAAVPAGTVTADRLVGDVLAAPVRAGEVLTDVRVLGSANAAVAPGHLALPVRLGDAGAVQWLRPGVRVRVLAVLADPVSGEVTNEPAARVVAREVVVLDVPDRGGGGLGLDGGGTDGTVVLLSVPEPDARAVAAAGAGGWLTVALLP